MNKNTNELHGGYLNGSADVGAGYKIHIGLNIVGAILLLVGTLVAIFRSSVGSNWYNYHRGAQLTAIALIAVSVLLALWLRSYYPRQDAKEHWWHGTVGVLILLLLILQGWWAIVMNSQVERSTFLTVHRILATLIWIGVLYQIYLGYLIVS